MTQQTFTTPGSAIFNVPGGVHSLTIEAWGAGGGGGGVNSASGDGGGGGGYSLAVVSVSPFQTVYYHVGLGGTGTADAGNNGEDSWVNPSANSEPVSNGVIGGGGGGAPHLSVGGASGIGSIGTTNFNGGQGAITQGGGGGGAGSAGNGGGGQRFAGGGGAGGTPDGGAGGNGSLASGSNGFAPGGGGGGDEDVGQSGYNGANGQVRFTYTVINERFLTNTTNMQLPINCVVVGNQPEEKKSKFITNFAGILKNIFRE